jgi:hypothetical protein
LGGFAEDFGFGPYVLKVGLAGDAGLDGLAGAYVLNVGFAGDAGLEGLAGAYVLNVGLARGGGLEGLAGAYVLNVGFCSSLELLFSGTRFDRCDSTPRLGRACSTFLAPPRNAVPLYDPGTYAGSAFSFDFSDLYFAPVNCDRISPLGESSESDESDFRLLPAIRADLLVSVDFPPTVFRRGATLLSG